MGGEVGAEVSAGAGAKSSSYQQHWPSTRVSSVHGPVARGARSRSLGLWSMEEGQETLSRSVTAGAEGPSVQPLAAAAGAAAVAPGPPGAAEAAAEAAVAAAAGPGQGNRTDVALSEGAQGGMHAEAVVTGPAGVLSLPAEEATARPASGLHGAAPVAADAAAVADTAPAAAAGGREPGVNVQPCPGANAAAGAAGIPGASATPVAGVGSSGAGVGSSPDQQARGVGSNASNAQPTPSRLVGSEEQRNRGLGSEGAGPSLATAGTIPDDYAGELPELRQEANRIHKGEGVVG